MVCVRENVYQSGDQWTDTLHWYAIGVRAARQRPFPDRTSWRFLAGMHAWHGGLWQLLGYLQPGEALPGPADVQTYLTKCQHGSWYFLPWHRGYLSAFERIIRAAIVAEGGPADWALPYWNYCDPDFARARTIPSAFTDQTMPDGSDNPLYTPYRFGDAQTGALTVPAAGVALDALAEPQFGSDLRIPGGFGGGRWPVAHSGNAPGMLEGTPHGDVHIAIGGSGEIDGQGIPGLMSSFVTAGLDPIFWLHHCNLDRLWEVWLKRRADHANPGQSDWLGGPADQPFVAPDRDGNPWSFNCADVVDTMAAPLDYRYDDLTDPLAGGGGLNEALVATGNVRGPVNWEERDTELISTSKAAVPLGPDGAVAQVPVPGAMLRHAASKMMAEALAPGEVERYFLLLDDVQGADNTAIYEVYVDYGAPGQEMPSGDPRAYLAGTLSTFGIAETVAGETASPPGLSRLYNITPVIERLGLDDEPDLDQLHVRIAPVTQNRAVAAPVIGRIAIYRETA